MPIINYKSSQIKLNVPNKTLSVNVTSVNGVEFWPHPNADDDLWFVGSATKRYYRWQITFSVEPQSHGSNLTRNDFVYNGLDIVVGDWIAGATSGACLKIISIVSKTKTQVTCVVEDWIRYNTFKSVTGNGMFNLGPAVLFGLNENGIPVLDPLPATVSKDFYPTVMSRFQYLNPALNYVLKQVNHGFQKGDVVAVTQNGFSKANSDVMTKMVGVVVDAGPGPDLFIVSPNNRIIDFEPAIPGTQGDFVYVDDQGRLTTQDTGKVLFLKIQDAIPTVLTGSVADPTLPDNHAVSINDTLVTFSQAGAVSLSTMVNQINNNTAQHNVVASAVPTPTQITSDSANTVYGVTGGFVPFSAFIDSGSGNTLINFTTSTVGQTLFSDDVAVAEDMATDITAGNIANLVVSYTNVGLTLTELNGNAINIFNNTADQNGNQFVGTSNISGLPATTAATNTQNLRLIRSDGGEILIFENTEFFRVNTGIASGHTGMYPLVINIEQGIRSGSTTVVADISARDSLTALVGDQAYVLDAGFGEWAMYLYDGADWVQLGNQDSSTVDAKTLVTVFTMPAAPGGDFTVQNMGSISPGRKVVSVGIEVNQVFSDFTGNISPNVQVGTISEPDLLVNSNSNDLNEQQQFIVNPEYVHPEQSETELTIRARCNHFGATAGQVTIKLTYV
jgi:hypothetical protein